MDLGGKAVGRNVRGELCIKGPQVMLGYYKNVEATKSTIDESGWIHTGKEADEILEGMNFDNSKLLLQGTLLTTMRKGIYTLWTGLRN